jgi:prepilin-type N-terminal cleavage/methylation domain-containing protein
MAYRTDPAELQKMKKHGFTLMELLIVVGIITILVTILLPSLASARLIAKSVSCKSNLKQLGLGLQFYADDFNDQAMPLVYGPMSGRMASLSFTYWWGQRIDPSTGKPALASVPAAVDHTKGFLWSYLKAGEQSNDVFACPAMPPGTYVGPVSVIVGQITSAYGYNGYYLCPKYAGYSEIANKPWCRLNRVNRPDRVFSFADVAIGNNMDLPRENPFLDPPLILRAGVWVANRSPTTHFRHTRKTNAIALDGHCEDFSIDQGHLATSPENQKHLIGYVGDGNDPHYVPDYLSW